MSAAEILALCDLLRPNHYSQEQKLLWLQTLDSQLHALLIKPRESEAPAPQLPYTGETSLLVPPPWDSELYLGFLNCQIDLNNAEIQKYNQSAALLSAAWRAYADSLNRQKAVPGGSKFMF